MVKILTGLILLFAFTVPANATTIPLGEAYYLSFHSHSYPDAMIPTPVPNVTMEGVLTVVPRIDGQFWTHNNNIIMNWMADALVIAASGTAVLDCAPTPRECTSGSYTFSLAPPTLGHESYLLGDFRPTPLRLQYDDGRGGLGLYYNYGRIFWSTGYEIPMTFTTTRVAAPLSVPDASSSLLLLALSMASLAGIRTRFAKHHS